MSQAPGAGFVALATMPALRGLAVSCKAFSQKVAGLPRPGVHVNYTG